MDNVRMYTISGNIPVQHSKRVSPPVNYKIKMSEKMSAVDSFVSSNPVKSKSWAEKAYESCLCRYAPEAYLNRYINKNVINNAVISNPEIQKLLKSKGLQPKICMENVTGKNNKHFLTTYKNAKELGKNLSPEDYDTLLQASLLHDIGKALIPKEIIDKPGKLTGNERDIINIHAALGAEILKSAGLPPKVIKAVQAHHTSYQSPLHGSNKASQILPVADVWSALKEARPYKAAFTDNQTKDIMEHNNNLNPAIVQKIPFKTV